LGDNKPKQVTAKGKSFIIEADNGKAAIINAISRKVKLKFGKQRIKPRRTKEK
jgi:hypothetical protein